jgi:hypothetical protein
MLSLKDLFFIDSEPMSLSIYRQSLDYWDAYCNGEYLKIIIDEELTMYLDSIAQIDYYLVKTQTLTKGKKQIKKQMIYALSHQNLVNLTSSFIDSLYGDAVNWLIFPEKKSEINYFLFFDRSIQIYIKYEYIDVFFNKVKLEWLKKALNSQHLSLNLLQTIEFNPNNVVEITNDHCSQKKYRQIICINDQKLIAVWMKSENQQYKLVSLAPSK